MLPAIVLTGSFGPLGVWNRNRRKKGGFFSSSPRSPLLNCPLLPHCSLQVDRPEVTRELIDLMATIRQVRRPCHLIKAAVTACSADASPLGQPAVHRSSASLVQERLDSTRDHTAIIVVFPRPKPSSRKNRQLPAPSASPNHIFPSPRRGTRPRPFRDQVPKHVHNNARAK